MSAWRGTLVLASVLALGGCKEREDPARFKLMQRLRDARPAARIVAIQQLAPKANKEETAALMRAAADAPADVRKVVAQALAKVDADNAVDLAASLLRDPSDEVRAAAVSTLASRGGARAMAYLAHAYESGGPAMRAAVLAAGPDVLTQAVRAEAKAWNEGLENRKLDKLETVQSEAIRDLGLSGSTTAIAELQTRLVDPKPVIAAASCLGLARAGVTSTVPQIVQATKSANSVVAQACALALTVLDQNAASESILPLLGSAELTPSLLSVLEETELDPALRSRLCEIARTFPDGATALRAATLAGATCGAAEPHVTSWTDVQSLQVLTALEIKSPAALKQARSMLGSSDAQAAALGAAYLGVAGTPQDGATIVKTVLAELNALNAARLAEAQKVKERRTETLSKKEQEETLLKSILGAKYDLIRKDRPKTSTEVLARLNRTEGPEVAETFEHRPGAIRFILTATAAAARLKADLLPLSGPLFDQSEPRLRQLELELAEFLADRGSILRERLRTSTDRDYRVGQALNDLRHGRAGAIDAALKAAKESSLPERAALVDLLAPNAAEYVATLLSWAQDEPLVPSIVRVVSDAPGEAVDRFLLERLADSTGTAVPEAIAALARRSNPAIDAALTRAAVHPVPEVRTAALRALAARHSCTSVPQLKGLREDYVGAVRTASAALENACQSTRTSP